MANNNSPIFRFLRMLIKNPASKLAALLFAFLLWNYVMSVTDVTRTVTLNNMTVTLNGLSTLKNAELALLSDPLKGLKNVSIELEVPNKDTGKVNQGNVSISLDVSGLIEPGEYTDVRLTARTSYGKVLAINPASLPVTVEQRMAISVPTEARVVGHLKNDFWVSSPSVSPDVITVAGPSSIVEKIAWARVDANVTGVEGTYRAPLKFTLMDADDRSISKDQLELDQETVNVRYMVLPQREYPLADMQLITGEPAEGYIVEEIRVQPETLTLAARPENMENLPDTTEGLALFDPVDITGLDRTRSFLRKLQIPENMVYNSISECYVEVIIREDATTETLELPIEPFGLTAGLTARFEPQTATLHVTGKQEDMQNLNPSRFQALAALAGYEAGEYEVGIRAYMRGNSSNIDLALESASVTVIIEQKENATE